MEFVEWLTETTAGDFVMTMMVSMVPIVELRGGIPYGVASGLPVWLAYIAAFIGNLIPVPFIVVYIRRIFHWIRRHMPKLNNIIDKLEGKAHLKGRVMQKYQYLGLAIFVAIPLPGTGAWTGALAAAFLDMRLKKAFPAAVLGVAVAGFLISILTFGVANMFGGV